MRQPTVRKIVSIRRVISITTIAMLPALAGVLPAVAQNANPAAAAQAQGSSRWPMTFDTSEGQVTIYQPQLTKFDGDKISGRAAVSVLKAGAAAPTFGAIWMESRVAVDRSTRIVQILDVTVTKSRFPDAGGVSDETMTAALQKSLPGQPMQMTLDQLLAEVQMIDREKAAVKEISTAPPAIIFKDHPAVLVQYDGAPKLGQMPNSNLLRADNTPFFVALDPSNKTYYLKGGGKWFAAADAMGPFRFVGQAPPEVAKLADDSGYQDPQTALSDAQAQGVEIVTATDPTEVIWTDGPEQMTPIANTNLLYVSNTDSDVFVQIDTQKRFVLLSGRWYVAASENGPWTYVAPDNLPPDFKLIPPGSEKGDVLAFVAGTQQAKDAVADALVPQTAAIDRANFEQPAVQYDGDANFQPIEGTDLSYAVNTPNSVILDNGQYYCCYDAAWYSSGSPNGPWGLCTAVPADIYTIPPSCPIYPCRFVYVYGFTPDLVYCGYTPGYVGCYPFDGVVVFGTGYRYHAWAGHAYYPRPFTFGFAARYDGYSGHWGFHVGFDSGQDAGWFGQRTGAVARRGGWFGHGGYRPTYEHGTRTSSIEVAQSEVRADELNLYQRRKDVRAVDVNRPHAVPGNAVQPRNDVLTDPEGNVYRKSADGWEQRQKDTWVPAQQPQDVKKEEPHPQAQPQPEPKHDEPKQNEPNHENPPAEQKHEAPPQEDQNRGNLNQDYQARQQGEQRQREYPSSPPPQEHNQQEPQHNPPPPQQQPNQNQGGGNQGGGNQGGGRKH